MKHIAFFIFASSIFISGCAPDVPELEKKVLARDPSFSVVIDTKNSMFSDLEETRTKYLNKKRATEAQIASLKKELENSRGEHIERMERLKKKLDPEITALKNEIKTMKNALVVKTSELSMVEKSINEIKELIQKGRNLEMTQEEMRMWNERMTVLVKKREEALKARDKANFDIETAEMKLSIITAK
ncbi:MAG TPA: hypothetical protein PKZ41_04400 [Candidatus Omnitrophota bacterium]|nr:hypothetical protein [Candidatus Omnitrophota bacterium]